MENKLKSFTILLAECVEEFAAGSKLSQPVIGQLSSVWSRKDHGPCEPASEEIESEASSNDCQACRGAKFVFLQRFLGRKNEEADLGEEEEFDAYSASSSDNSMRVLYPRHSMRV